MTQGWGFESTISKVHYFTQLGKPFWNKYPPDLNNTGYCKPEEYYINYVSLCGRDTFARPVKPSKRNGFMKLVLSKTAKNPCIKCLKILARKKGIV